MALTVLLVVSTALLTITTVWESRKPIGTALVLPAVWLLTIPLQAWLLAPRLNFTGATRDQMYLAISIANFAFALFQVASGLGLLQRLRDRTARWAERLNGGPTTEPGNTRYWFGGLLVLAVGLAVLHWSVMPSIPLVQMLQGVDPNQLQISRENSAKLLAVPTILKYAFTWDSRVLLPMVLVIAVLNRWKWAAAFVAVFGLAYIMSPLERLPAVMFLLAPVVAVAVRDGKKIWSPLVVVGVVLALLPALAITEVMQYRIPSGETVTASGGYTSSDGGGLSPSEFKGLPRPIASALDLVLRRIGEGPVDVTYEWFAYFPAQHPFLKGSAWEPWNVLSPGYQTPANMVGLWAYYGKPGYNLTSISAYGSFIADGWSEFGMPGVVLACLLLLGIGVGLEVLRALGSRPFLLACYVVPLVLVSTVTPQSSIPAMVLSSGVFLVPLLAAGFLLTNRSRFSAVPSLRLGGTAKTP